MNLKFKDVVIKFMTHLMKREEVVKEKELEELKMNAIVSQINSR